MTDYSDKQLKSILKRTKTIAAVGISTNTIRPSHFVGRFMSRRNYRIIPVNPMYPGQSLFDEPIYPSLADIPGDFPIHMVDIFRRSDQVLPVVSEAIKALIDRGLHTIWMQIGVINYEAEKLALDAGLEVIMDRCPKIEYQRLFEELRMGGFNTGIISSKLD